MARRSLLVLTVVTIYLTINLARVTKSYPHFFAIENSNTNTNSYPSYNSSVAFQNNPFHQIQLAKRKFSSFISNVVTSVLGFLGNNRRLSPTRTNYNSATRQKNYGPVRPPNYGQVRLRNCNNRVNTGYIEPHVSTQNPKKEPWEAIVLRDRNRGPTPKILVQSPNSNPSGNLAKANEIGDEANELSNKRNKNVNNDLRILIKELKNNSSEANEESNDETLAFNDSSTLDEKSINSSEMDQKKSLSETEEDEKKVSDEDEQKFLLCGPIDSCNEKSEMCIEWSRIDCAEGNSECMESTFECFPKEVTYENFAINIFAYRKYESFT